MTEIERKALALLNEVREERGRNPWQTLSRECDTLTEALCRAIEQHEAFRQEVSDAVEESIYTTWEDHPSARHLTRFILPKPDPLDQIAGDMHLHAYNPKRDWGAEFRAALAARGLKIVEDK